MLPSRCSSLQPQEELQVGIRPRHRIKSASPEIASTQTYGFFGVFVVAFFSAVGFVALVSFVPVAPLYALP